MDMDGILSIVAIVSAVGSAGVLWGVMTERMSNMRESIDRNAKKLEEHDKEIVAGGIRFARIEGKLDTIGDDISDVKKLLEKQAQARPH